MFVCRTIYEIFSVKEWRDLEIGGRGRSIDHIRLSIIYTSLFHQRNGSSKNTYNIINKKNTIRKHKLNMTVISLVKNMTIKLQSILEYSPQLINFSFFSRNFLVRLSKRTLGSSKPNMCWQVLTMLMSEVFSNFMNSLFTTLVRHCNYCSILYNFRVIWKSKYHDLEIYVRGYSRSLKLAPFDIHVSHTSSPSSSVTAVRLYLAPFSK